MEFQKLFIVIIAISISSCVSQQSMFEKAKSENSVELYEKFLEKNPNSEFSDEAKNNLITLEFKNAENANSISIYEKFLEKYPDSEFSDEAKNNLITLEFKNAENANSINAYEKFLQKYPKNNLLQDAQRNIMRIKYEKAVSANSSELYKEFLINYPKSNYREDIENKLHKLSYQDYISASINIGSNKYKNVKIKNLILMRVVDKKTRSKQGYPVMSPRGSFLIENGKVKIDKSKKAYYINYFAINGQDIREINANTVSIHTSKNIYKLSIVDDNPKLNDSFLINSVVINLLDQSKSFGKETALSMGFSWFGKLRNEDFALFARKNFQTSYGIPDVGVLSLSTIDEKTLTGNILGQLLFDGEKYFVESTIQVIENNTGEIIKINL